MASRRGKVTAYPTPRRSSAPRRMSTPTSAFRRCNQDRLGSSYDKHSHRAGIFGTTATATASVVQRTQLNAVEGLHL